MKVYHGSLEIVPNPEIRISGRTLDYGFGFYTTTDYDQARRWVERRKNDGVDSGYIKKHFGLTHLPKIGLISFTRTGQTGTSNMILTLYMVLSPMTRYMQHSHYMKTACLTNRNSSRSLRHMFLSTNFYCILRRL